MSNNVVYMSKKQEILLENIDKLREGVHSGTITDLIFVTGSKDGDIGANIMIGNVKNYFSLIGSLKTVNDSIVMQFLDQGVEEEDDSIN